MLPQCTRIRAGIVPLVAFVWLFSTAQCAVCTVSFPRNRTRWDMTSHSTIVISFNIFFPQLVRLRGKHFYEHFCDLQTLNLWFSLNYTPVSTTEFWRFMPHFLSKYMGILLSPVSYTGNTGGSYCTMCALCTVHLKLCPRIACPRRGIVTLVAFVWLFSTVHFRMYPQIACIRGCIVTLVAFIWLFSTVCFQMSPQSACMRRCIVTLVAFVWLFSTVHFQMYPQIACIRGCIVTLVAFVWLFSSVRFQMCPQIVCPGGCKVT